jgi:resuscitation-promoting factor RpfB
MDVQAGPYDAVYINGVEASQDESLANGAMAVLPPAVMAAFGRTAPDARGLEVTLYRAVPFTIVEDGQALAVKSSRPTVALALKDAGIKLGPADLVYPEPAEALTSGQQITVKHASAVSIRLGDSARLVYTQKTVLRDALAESGLSLGPDDRVEPSLESRVENGMTARLVRVAGKAAFEREEIVHKTVFKPDENLHGSASRVVQGRDGVRVREFRIVIEDGVERERKLIKDSFDPEQNDTVIYYAAGDVQATGLSTESMTVNRTMRMAVTWYDASSSGKANTDRSYGITASGAPVTKGIVAVDPRVIPLGTRLFIPGYSFAVAGDTGGAVIGNVIDLGYPDGVVPDFKTGNYDVYILSS